MAGALGVTWVLVGGACAPSSEGDQVEDAQSIQEQNGEAAAATPGSGAQLNDDVFDGDLSAPSSEANERSSDDFSPLVSSIVTLNPDDPAGSLELATTDPEIVSLRKIASESAQDCQALASVWSPSVGESQRDVGETVVDTELRLALDDLVLVLAHHHARCASGDDVIDVDLNQAALARVDERLAQLESME